MSILPDGGMAFSYNRVFAHCFFLKWKIMHQSSYKYAAALYM